MNPPGGDEPSDGDDEEPPRWAESADSSGGNESTEQSPRNSADSPGGNESVDSLDPDESTTQASNRPAGPSQPDTPNGGEQNALREGCGPRESSDNRDESWARENDDEDDGFGAREFTYDILSSIVAVGLVGLFLFAVSGVWPPLVAVESPSMDPHMQKGDLVFVMDEQRFPGANAHGDTGVVTARAANGEYTKFEQQGDVIVFEPNGDSGRTPIIHRAMFWVDEGENWYDKADRQYLGGAGDCSELSHCPANRSGFITLGDNNNVYDQTRPNLRPVEPQWVIGTAELRIPALGWVRLRSGAAMSVGNATAVVG